LIDLAGISVSVETRELKTEEAETLKKTFDARAHRGQVRQLEVAGPGENDAAGLQRNRGEQTFHRWRKEYQVKQAKKLPIAMAR
jgi:hypothetical protein